LNETKAARYQRLRRRAGAVELALGGAALAVLAVTPLGSGLARWADAAGGRSAASLVLFVSAVVLAWLAAVLPARLYLGRRLSERLGPAESAAGALLDTGQASLLVLAAALVAAGVLQLAAWVAPVWWWLVAGLLLAAVLVLALRGLPIALVRFASPTPLDRGRLAKRLAGLARQAGVAVASIDVLPSGAPKDATAFVAGIGRTRRIFISPELLRDWTDDEIAVVVAHELGHHARHDLWRAATLTAATSLTALGAADAALRALGPALGLGGPANLQSWPLIAVVAGAVWMAATPVRHAQSRRHERKADEFALRLTGETDAFAAAIRRLGARHLAEERPTAMTRWLFHRHPPVAERLALANRFKGD
jgi:STE24 endopeptidase